MKSAVAFFVFKRPECTLRVWEEIRRAQPPILLVVADGPRTESERAACEATRAVVARVDWPCDVRRNYSFSNMGCRDRVASGLCWVFDQVDEAVILEDDCLPHADFFAFCDEMLEFYRGDEKVMHVSGDNFQNGRKRGGGSYYFSKYAHIWGWATWRRAWRYYDVEMSSWRECGDKVVATHCADRIERHYWTTLYRGVAEGRVSTWDYAWMYACWRNFGLCILPNTNLVSNIGFGEAATHTRDAGARYASLKTDAIEFPLRHPERAVEDQDADRHTFRTMFVPHESIMRRVVRRCKKLIWQSGKGAGG